MESLQAAGVKVKVGLITSRTSPIPILKNIDRLSTEIKAFQPDIIHCHYGSMVGWIGIRAANDNYPVVVSFCGDDLLGTPNRGGLWRLRESLAIKLSKITANKVDQIIVKSNNLFDTLSNRQQAKTHIIPNGIDADFFYPVPDKSVARKKLGWALDEFVVFFNSSQGTNRAVKNPELAYETIKILKEKDLKIRMEDVSNLDALAFRDRLVASDCLLVTSLHEGSPNIVKEALASNVPVVSVDCGDVKMRLQTVNAGGVFKYDAADLARGITQVMEFKGEFNGRATFFEQQLSEAVIAKKIIEVYKTFK